MKRGLLFVVLVLLNNTLQGFVLDVLMKKGFVSYMGGIRKIGGKK